jgi:hypothetical protein
MSYYTVLYRKTKKRTPTITALDAMAEVFSDETSATLQPLKGVPTLTQQERADVTAQSTRAPKCGQFVVLFSED